MRRWLVVFSATVLAAGAIFGVEYLASGGGDSSNARVGGRSLASRTVEAGSVTVELAPKRVDTRAAEFAISLDTHSGGLGIDLGRATSVTVGGTAWPFETYRGDGPGGHHRSGVLRFRAIGPVRGALEVTIQGLDGPVRATWSLGNG